MSSPRRHGVPLTCFYLPWSCFSLFYVAEDQVPPSAGAYDLYSAAEHSTQSALMKLIGQGPNSGIRINHSFPCNQTGDAQDLQFETYSIDQITGKKALIDTGRSSPSLYLYNILQVK
jgi:hypothetical protein